MSRIDVDTLRSALRRVDPVVVSGRVTRAAGMTVAATLPGASLGTMCEIEGRGGETALAEVVGFEGATVLLMPVGELSGIKEGARVIPLSAVADLPVGDELLGRVVDEHLRPIDGQGAVRCAARAPLRRRPPPAMARARVATVVETGLRVIDSCLTLGEGQRVGILAGAGVGKSVFLGSLARAASADVVVVGLIGERGREVREFIERDLGTGLARSVVVVATGDAPPLSRVYAADAATAVAEHFRDRGMRVLLLMDSLTRVAMAQREIGLAAGEPPTSKGYPPSVFAALPRLVERAGMGVASAGRRAGSITAVYTVLVEGDDLSDPVADAARAALDGHWVLSRKLAGAGHFPAVDVLSSVSRVMTDIVPADQVELARRAREVLATLNEAAPLVDAGAYVAGSNPKVDAALRVRDELLTFLRQRPDERTARGDALGRLRTALLERMTT
jgi:flagellum-specific ATP synthase